MRLTKEYKDKLKDQVKVYLRKHPGASLEAMKEFIKEGDPTVFDNVPRQQINSLLKYDMESSPLMAPWTIMRPEEAEVK